MQVGAQLFLICTSPRAPLAEAYGGKIISYADDTQLIFSCDKGKDIDGDEIRSCLTEVFKWLKENQLKCNSDKSHSFLRPALCE